jgi:hypothetical protein
VRYACIRIHFLTFLYINSITFYFFRLPSLFSTKTVLLLIWNSISLQSFIQSIPQPRATALRQQLDLPLIFWLAASRGLLQTLASLLCVVPSLPPTPTISSGPRQIHLQCVYIANICMKLTDNRNYNSIHGNFGAYSHNTSKLETF